MADKVVWLDRGGLPTHVGFCPSAKAWKREMKRLGVKNSPYPQTDGRCSTFESEKGKTCVIITTGPRDDDHSAIEIIGILAHEVTHAWQAICRDIGEHEPSHEFEAYAMQRMLQDVVQAYADTRGRKLTT